MTDISNCLNCRSHYGPYRGGTPRTPRQVIMCREKGFADIYKENWEGECPYYTCHHPVKYNLSPLVTKEVQVCGGKGT